VLLRAGAGLTDGQLLGCFIDHRDEAAFASLVRRHGPIVWGVCRRILRHHHDAEDAFQAAFLVFVRKAASIRSRAQVGNWLYGRGAPDRP
jgi:DNA-directed RNA polymerase specialized sigma24 family protein